MLQYPGVISADGMVLRPGVFSRLACEAFDACVLMLLQMCSKLTYSVANVNLSTGAWHSVDDVCLLLHSEGVMKGSEECSAKG